MSLKLLLTAISLMIMVRTSLAVDQSDWVNPSYAIQADDPTFVDSRNTIIRNADTIAKNGPWSVTNSHGVRAPSGNAHDYLSWAPYHWPDCNWCGKPEGRKHFAHPGDSNENNTSEDNGGTEDGDLENEPDEIPSNGNLAGNPYDSDLDGPIQRRSDDHLGKRLPRRMLRRRLANRSEVSSASSFASDTITGMPTASTIDLPQAPETLPTRAPSFDSTTSSTGVVGTHAPAQNAAKSKKGKDKACTPSPTTSMAPSATWTTCPYVVRDGQVNPDVRSLPGPQALNDLSQAILYNTLAYLFTESAKYAQYAASYLDTFFVNPSTAMSPNMNFGQIVRGPGSQGVSGTFTGILDMRGNVKTINSMIILKESGSPQWTRNLEKGMISWYSSFLHWMTTSGIGKAAGSKPNNHGTFYLMQEASIRMFIGDRDGAASALQRWFNHQFLDQIAQSGEQPFEAVRTRPFHYRCFNLEALVAVAKLGDELGLDLWHAKSKYGATIQTAIDFAMKMDPKKEDGSVVIPHVAAARAVYGDPTGKYAAFLQNKMPSYKSKPFWFYDQPSARPNKSPKKGKSTPRGEGGAQWAASSSFIPFECPAVFKDEMEVEIEDGLVITCDDVRVFFEMLSS